MKPFKYIIMNKAIITKYSYFSTSPSRPQVVLEVGEGEGDWEVDLPTTFSSIVVLKIKSIVILVGNFSWKVGRTLPQNNEYLPGSYEKLKCIRDSHWFSG